VALAKARDRRVIRGLVGRDHPKGDVLDAGPLDLAGGAQSARVRVEENGDHQRRVVRRPAMAIGAVGRVEDRQVHLLDRVEHEPREVALRQPLPQ
jgi:hypothetical protein